MGNDIIDYISDVNRGMMQIPRPFIFSLITFLALVTISSSSVYAQKISKQNRTENLDGRKDANRKRNAPKKKKIRDILVRNTKNTLYANPCVIEQTHKMGFEYVPVVPTGPKFRSGWRIFWNNTKVKLGLVVRRSPFWKAVLNKRIKRCRIQSGDFVGD